MDHERATLIPGGEGGGGWIGEPLWTQSGDCVDHRATFQAGSLKASLESNTPPLLSL